MHLNQQRFCERIKDKFPDCFYQKKVLEIGSLDINGSIRYLFKDCEYIGIDLGAGKGVDLICSGHELNRPDNYYDTIISTEAFEHDKHYKETIKNAMRMLKPEGLFLFSCAFTGRPEHGTNLNKPEQSPFTHDYYKNLTIEDFRGIDGFRKTFPEGIFEQSYCDLFFYGIKRKE